MHVQSGQGRRCYHVADDVYQSTLHVHGRAGHCSSRRTAYTIVGCAMGRGANLTASEAKKTADEVRNFNLTRQNTIAVSAKAYKRLREVLTAEVVTYQGRTLEGLKKNLSEIFMPRVPLRDQSSTDSEH